MPIGSLNRRERRVVAVGGAIATLALVARFAILPFAARWNAREDMIASTAETLGRMKALVGKETSLRSSLKTRESSMTGRRLVSGRTTALAGSVLQAAIQGYADRSKVTINRLDLAGPPDSSATNLPGIPVTVSAVGDVYGLSEFLSHLQYDSPVIQVSQLTVVSNSSLRGGLLQMTFQLHAPAVIE